MLYKTTSYTNVLLNGLANRQYPCTDSALSLRHLISPPLACTCTYATSSSLKEMSYHFYFTWLLLTLNLRLSCCIYIYIYGTFYLLFTTTLVNKEEIALKVSYTLKKYLMNKSLLNLAWVWWYFSWLRCLQKDGKAKIWSSRPITFLRIELSCLATILIISSCVTVIQCTCWFSYHIWTWFIRYIYYWNIQLLSNVIINKTKVLLPQE